MPPLTPDTLALVGAHDAVTLHVPWGVAWILGVVLLLGVSQMVLEVAAIYDGVRSAIRRRVRGW